jgi:hypothetical protein
MSENCLPAEHQALRDLHGKAPGSSSNLLLHWFDQHLEKSTV